MKARQESRGRLETAIPMVPTGALHHRVATDREKVAFTTGQDSWTYERVATEVERLARGLIRRGLRKGDRVALHMANLPELVIAYHACFKLGVIAAPLNIRFKAAELKALLQRLRPSLYVGQAALYSQLASIDSSILASNARFIVDGSVNDPRVQPWTELFAETNGRPIPVSPDVDAPAVLLTTSGTTGQPKFVIHTLATLSKLRNHSGTGILIATRSPRCFARWYTGVGCSPCLPVSTSARISSYVSVLIPTPSSTRLNVIAVPGSLDCRSCF